MVSKDEFGGERTEPGDCICLTPPRRSSSSERSVTPPRWPHSEERYIGTDKTNGRFADVTLRRCKLCGRLWLRYQVEYEAFSRSGRWAEGVIDQVVAATVTPERAPGVLSKLPWHIHGGSWFGHAGRKAAGPIPEQMWDTVGEGPA